MGEDWGKQRSGAYFVSPALLLQFRIYSLNTKFVYPPKVIGRPSTFNAKHLESGGFNLPNCIQLIWTYDKIQSHAYLFK